MNITKADIDALLVQNEFAKDKLAARWSELAERMEDMIRLLSGESDNNDADAALVAMCVETCWAQCTVYYTEMQLAAALSQVTEGKTNEST